jgi:predicted MFS family arabinose efflux permease
VQAVFRLFRDAYRDLPAATWLLAAAGFINRSGAMVLPYLSIYLGAKFHYDFEQAGLFGSLYGVGAVVGSLLGGRFCDRIGAVRVQIITLAAACVWLWLLAAVDSPWWFGAGLFVFGVFNDAFRPGNFTSAIDSCPAELRPKAMALNRLALNAGWMCGPAIGGLLANSGDFTRLFFVDGLTCGLAALFLFLFRHRLPQRARRDNNTPAAGPSPFRDRRFLWLCWLSTAAMLMFLQSVFTQNRYLHDDLGFPTAQIGALAALNPLVIVICEMPLVQMLRRRQRLPTVALGVVCVGFGLSLLSLRAGGLPIVLASIGVVVIGEMLWAPQLGAYIGDQAPAASRGRYMGVYTATISSAMVLSPWLGGAVYEHFSPAALWLGCGGAGVVIAAGFLWTHRRAPGAAA